MEKWIKPVIVVSQCLGFKACRYNSQILHTPFIEKLKDFVEFIAVCPEVEIGLGIPRDPIRIVLNKGSKELFQPSSGLDITDKMKGFTDNFLSEIPKVDGFILKNRSPSCGIADVKIYSSKKKDANSHKGSGFFGGEVRKKFPDCAIEDEGRLNNTIIREHFLIKLFTLSQFNRLNFKINELVHFHTRHKLLFMAYNQSAMRRNGRILANHEHKEKGAVFAEYKEGLLQIFKNAPKNNAYINILQHGFSGIKKNLEKMEKNYFLDLLEEYRDERIPLSVPVAVLKSWAVKYKNDYILEQSFIQPFPKELINIENYKSNKEYSFY